MATLVSYDTQNDILALHQGFAPDEAFKGNLDAGDLIPDLSTKERVRGLEILNTSRFLRQFGITSQGLRPFVDADFCAEVRRDAIALSLMLGTAPAKIAVAVART
jgi:hypothetical protein